MAAVDRGTLQRIAQTLGVRWLAYHDTMNTSRPVESTFTRPITGGAGFLYSNANGQVFLVRGSPRKIIKDIQRAVGATTDAKWGQVTQDLVLAYLHQIDGTGWDLGTPMTPALMEAALHRFIIGERPLAGHPEIAGGVVVLPERTELPDVRPDHNAVDPGGNATYLHAIQVSTNGDLVGPDGDLVDLLRQRGAGTTQTVQAVAQSTPDIAGALNQQACQAASGEWHQDQLQSGCYTPGTYVAPATQSTGAPIEVIPGLTVSPNSATNDASMFSGGVKLLGLLGLLGGIAWVGAKVGERVSKIPLARERVRSNPRRHRR